uniref:Neur_chan_LBD domain-containing protein n=1 Tax=Heterorhabditis bacteriophora TaxID=37862 RepID=A0A1I7X706_HETBA
MHRFYMTLTMASDAEDRLMVDLFRGYNSLVQPVRNKTELPMIVKIAMQLVLLINVDEKEQVMHTNVWLTLKWHDFQMQWEPKDYDGITQIRVAPDKIWLPDIVLFNNADGNYEVSFMCNALIHHSGEVLWVPPAIYKSSCIIDVEFFPFDDQRCSLTFGSWTVIFFNLNLLKYFFKYRIYIYIYIRCWRWENAPLIRISHPSCEDLTPEAQRAVDAIEFITENMKDDETTKQYRDDWKYVAMVVDRLLLYGFFGITLGGTIGILFSAPTVFERVDEEKQLQKLIQLYKQGISVNDSFA